MSSPCPEHHHLAGKDACPHPDCVAVTTPDFGAYAAERIAEGAAQGCIATVIVVLHQTTPGFVKQMIDSDGEPKVMLAYVGPDDLESVAKLTPMVLLHAFMIRAKRERGFVSLVAEVRDYCRRFVLALKKGLPPDQMDRCNQCGCEKPKILECNHAGCAEQREFEKKKGRV